MYTELVETISLVPRHINYHIIYNSLETGDCNQLQSFVHGLHTTISVKETCLQDFHEVYHRYYRYSNVTGSYLQAINGVTRREGVIRTYLLFFYSIHSNILENILFD